jgi:copper chaperone
MEQSFRIDGMHCGGCVARVSRALQTIADEVSVTLDPPRATLQASERLSVEAVQAALQAAGHYTVSAD